MQNLNPEPDRASPIRSDPPVQSGAQDIEDKPCDQYVLPTTPEPAVEQWGNTDLL